MISNDIELKVTRERISYFQSLLAQLRTTVTREEFPLVSGGYRAEIETMQQDVCSIYPNILAMWRYQPKQ